MDKEVLEIEWYNYPETEPRFSGTPMLLEVENIPYYIIGSWNPEKKFFCKLYSINTDIENANKKINGNIKRFAYLDLFKREIPKR